MYSNTGRRRTTLPCGESFSSPRVRSHVLLRETTERNCSLHSPCNEIPISLSHPLEFRQTQKLSHHTSYPFSGSASISEAPTEAENPAATYLKTWDCINKITFLEVTRYYVNQTTRPLSLTSGCLLMYCRLYYITVFSNYNCWKLKKTRNNKPHNQIPTI